MHSSANERLRLSDDAPAINNGDEGGGGRRKRGRRKRKKARPVCGSPPWQREEHFACLLAVGSIVPGWQSMLAGCLVADWQ